MWAKMQKPESEGDPLPHDSGRRRLIQALLVLMTAITNGTVAWLIGRWLPRSETVTQRGTTMSASYAVAHPKLLEDELQLVEHLEIRLIPASDKTGI
jgi:hypothetical protein